MAKKSEEGINKSEAIRTYYKTHRKAKAQEVVDGLAKEGVTVSISLVNTVKSKHNRRRKARRQVVEAAAPSGIGVKEIKLALAFIKGVGSVDGAKKALAAALEIKKIV